MSCVRCSPHTGSNACKRTITNELDEFMAAYAETMDRVDSDAYLRFPRSYFDQLRGALGSRLHLVGVRIDERFAAGALFTEVDGVVQYHLGGTYDRYLGQHPTKALFHFARAHFRQRGNRVLHLGGGLGGRSDSLHHFKAGFSKHRWSFRCWKVIADPDTYTSLAADHGAPAGSSFFPAYRAPL